jgi:tetratricopeptide (TPR) repeat protein
MRSGRRLCAVALVAALVSGSMRGEPLAVADETNPANVAAARRHFDRARAYYAQGAYREAISELEAAHALDPNAKDLVFNLGVVHEKLADIDDALKWFRLYTSMNLNDQERERANAYLRRLEGAKKELDAKQAAAASGSSSSGAPTPPPPPPPEKPQYGRIDAYTIAAASVAVVGLGTGIVLGIKAVSDSPSSNSVTGSNLPYQQLVNRTRQAHNEAIGADIGFGVAVAAAAVTAYLYLARRPRSTAPSTTGATTVSAAPLTGGGAFFVQGSF